MTDDLDALVQLAEAATPGPTELITHIGSKRIEHLLPEDCNVETAYATADFIAACSPDTILTLIRRVRELEAGIRALIDEADTEARRFIPRADINMRPFVAADKLRALLSWATNEATPRAKAQEALMLKRQSEAFDDAISKLESEIVALIDRWAEDAMMDITGRKNPSERSAAHV